MPHMQHKAASPRVIRGFEMRNGRFLEEPSIGARRQAGRRARLAL